MDSTLILSTAAVFLMVLCLLFAGFLWAVNSKNKLSNRILAGMLIVLAISISAFWYGFYFEVHLGLDRIRDDINILVSPLLFLFICSALHSNFKLRWIHVLHLLPFIVITLVLVPNFNFASSELKLAFRGNYFEQTEVKITNVIRFVTTVGYYTWSYVVLYQAKLLILANHSDDKIRLYNWLWQLNTISVAIFLVSLTKGFLRFQVSAEAFQFVRLGMVLTLISFLIWMVMKALHHPLLFRGLDGSLLSVSQILERHKENNGSEALDEDEI
ncbi:MAG: hypothetical protein ACI9FN_003905 [Saprospiraceae bacterium]